MGADWPVAWRALLSAVAGAVIALIGVAALQSWLGIMLGWTCAAALYVIWTWVAIGHFDADETSTHATREDPTRALTDVLVLIASLASLVGVGVLLLAANNSQADRSWAAGIGAASVVSAWFLVHTVFTARYARLFYAEPGSIDFGDQREPSYSDFAYVAFTLGMTYQVSDTTLRSPTVRATALRHALLSFFLGAVVLATTINLVAGLGSSLG